MLTNKEYRLLMKIHKHRVNKVEDLWPWEFKTFYSLHEKGCVELVLPEERKQQLQNGEVMLDEHTGGKTDNAKECVKPELEPGPSRVFTPAFLRRILGTLFSGVLLGLIFSLITKFGFVLM